MSVTEIILDHFPDAPPFVEAEIEAVWQKLLEDQPNRVRHITGVVKACNELAPEIAPDPTWPRLLELTALYHDIGYAASLRRVGFHPLDGAILMAHQGLPEITIHAVLHHSGARESAKLIPGVAEFYTKLPAYVPTRVSDAITYCDMQTSPTGKRITMAERIEEIAARYGKASQTAIVMRGMHVEFDQIHRWVEALRRITRALEKADTMAAVR